MRSRPLIHHVSSLFALAAAACLLPGCQLATADSHMRTLAQIAYVVDEGGDYWQTPAETWRLGRGDCEDQAFYLRELLLADGIDARVVFGVRNVFTAETGHAWVECPLDGERFVLDPTTRRMHPRAKLPGFLYYPVTTQPILDEKLADYYRRANATSVPTPASR